jgi:magnesium chelatase family protein
VNHSSSPAGYATVIAAQPIGAGAELVTIETDLSQGLHAFSIVGLPDKAIEESRDRISAAIRHTGFKSPKATNRRIVLSLSPADLRKEGSQYDLPLALCYLAAAGEIQLPQEPFLFVGELGLNGTLRGTRGVLAQILAANRAGISSAFVPPVNAREASLCKEMRVYAPSSLLEAVMHLKGEVQLSPYENTASLSVRPPSVELSEIRGQESAKRAVEIASAGRHNLLLYGPPGTGKTMLARSIPGLLPSLTHTETLEVMAIHSTAGTLREGETIDWPPFRAPHHTASATSLIGGGSFPRAGEITLAPTTRR